MTAAVAATQAPVEPGTLHRVFDAHWLNRVANDPDVEPWVRGWLLGHLDLSAVAADQRNVCLAGPTGAMIFQWHMNGLFEVHTASLPRGRGRGTLAMVHAGLRWMFAGTDAMEIFTRIPQGNLAAATLVRSIKGTYQFTNPTGWVKDKDPIPAGIYSMIVQDWVRQAPGLAERGIWFYDRLASEMSRLGGPVTVRFDEAHDRHIGACYEMLISGQPDKAVVFANRYCSMTGFGRLAIVNYSPLTVDLGFAIAIIRDDRSFWVASLK